MSSFSGKFAEPTVIVSPVLPELFVGSLPHAASVTAHNAIIAANAFLFIKFLSNRNGGVALIVQV